MSGRYALPLAALLTAGCLNFTDDLQCRDSSDCRDDHLCLASLCKPRGGLRAVVTVDPQAVTLVSGERRQLSANVSGLPDTGVVWSVREAGGGSLTAASVYTAPGAAGVFHLDAHSRADFAQVATVVATVLGVSVAVSPSQGTVAIGGTLRFTATVANATDQGVTWSIDEADGGSIGATGLYSAAGKIGTFHVRAASVSDPRQSSVVPVTTYWPPANIAFVSQPSSGVTGPLGPIDLKVLDWQQQPVVVPRSVSMALVGGTPGAALGGTTRQVLVGAGTFIDLGVDVPGTYHLRASVDETSADSGSFTIRCPDSAGTGPFALAGTVSGLTTAGLVLGADGQADLGVPAASSAFSFATPVPSQTAYIVSIVHQPAHALCSISAPRGAVGCGPTAIAVACAPLADWRQVAVGGGHTLAVGSDGSLWSWGLNDAGQLGDGTKSSRSAPYNVGGGFARVSAGDRHSVALKSDGSLWTWGSNDRLQLGDGTSVYSSPTPHQIDTAVVSVAAGEYHTVYVKADGSLLAFGYSSAGQLGDGTGTNRGQPVKIGDGFASAAAGWSQSFALKADGALWAFGDNSSGQLDGTRANGAQLAVPVQVATGIAAVASGFLHTLLVKADGTLAAWGSLGLTAGGTAALVGSSVTAVGAGEQTSFLVRPDGSLWSWGQENGLGQLGDGTQEPRLDPVLVASGIASVQAGPAHVVAVKSDSTLLAWGSRADGRLGDGKNELHPKPRPIAVQLPFARVAAGSCASALLQSDGTLWTAGCNDQGQLGIGNAGSHAFLVKVGSGYASASVGTFHMLAVTTDGTLHAWGAGNFGVLGTGDEVSRNTPTVVGGGYSAAAAGASHSLALKKDGTLYAFGLNAQGQLGDGTLTQRNAPVVIGTGYASISAGQQYSLAVKTDGTLWAWGDNSQGQLGDGTLASRRTPTLVGTGYSLAAAGWDTSFGVKADGTLMLWGANITLTLSPAVAGTGFAAVDTRSTHAIALRSDGSVWTWGSNQFGELGDGTLQTRTEFAPVGPGFTSVAAGESYSLGLKADGSLWGWGSNASGQQGDDSDLRLAPEPIP